MKHFWLLACMLFASLFLTSCEDGLYQGSLVTSGVHRLEAGERGFGPMLLLGGEVIVAPSARLDGPVYIAGGRLIVSGEVADDVSIIGGRLDLERTARLQGNLNIGGGQVNRSAQAHLEGRVNTGSGLRIPRGDAWEEVRVQRNPRSSLIGATLLAVLAALAVRFRPSMVQRTAAAAWGHPLVSGSLGLLAGFVAPVLLVAMAFTIVLIPVTLAGLLLAAAVLVFGWISIGSHLGQVIFTRLGRQIPAPLQAAIGAWLLALGLDLLTLLPLFGDLASLAVTLVGLGSVLLTRFGLSLYTPSDDTAASDIPLPDTG